MRSRLSPQAPGEKKQVLVVDDHPIIREGLAQLINKEEDMIVAGEASTASEALQIIEKIRPDISIVDISLAGISGIELTKNILSLHPDMPILIMSFYEESLYLDRVMKAGARGYLMKQEATAKIILAIRKVLSGEIFISEKMKNSIVNQLAHRPHASSTVPSPEILSDRELEVLQLISKAYSTRQIAKELHVSVKTVESHNANIKNKLDLKNSHELIQYAVKWDLIQKNI